MAVMKIRKNKGGEIERKAGVSLSITGIDDEDTREEVADWLSNTLLASAQLKKILNGQLTLTETTNS